MFLFHKAAHRRVIFNYSTSGCVNEGILPTELLHSASGEDLISADGYTLIKPEKSNRLTSVQPHCLYMDQNLPGPYLTGRISINVWLA